MRRRDDDDDDNARFNALLCGGRARDVRVRRVRGGMRGQIGTEMLSGTE